MEESEELAEEWNVVREGCLANLGDSVPMGG
jgi:hypothetical protein